MSNESKTEAHRLNELGQSVWLDSISRDMLQGGDLERMIDELGIVGVTSNPTIFAQALSGSDLYDDHIAEVAGSGADDRAVFERLAGDDIRDACDALRSVYERTDGVDGMVSIEIEPDLAHDTDASLERAHELWNLVDRPNLMIKVPATEEGLPVVEELIFAGINVNVTLLFAVAMHREVMERYLRGLERRAEAGLDLNVASVASFFVSRVDTAVDAELERIGSADAAALLGKVAVANAELAWDAYLSVFTSDRFLRLKAAGALPQRPLWASTGTKNPAYPDILYVQDLIVPGTVNTMPLKTLQAFIDHGEARVTIENTQPAHELVAKLADVGVDLDAITTRLRVEGVDSFVKSYEELLAGLADKRSQLASA